MKTTLAALPFAAVLALGLAGGAQAFPIYTGLGAMEAEYSAEYDQVDQAGAPYHRCHGRSAGTAHETCGTLTGGPAGGLF